MKRQSRKSILAVMLSIALGVSGLLYIPNQEVKASELGDVTTSDGSSRVYHKVTYEFFKEHIEAHKAPVKDGYLFAGWVTTDGKVIDAVDDEDINKAQDNITAKFVPAHIAGVACQTKADISTATGATTDFRMVSAVDGANYQGLGYNLYKRVLQEDGTYLETQLCAYVAGGTNLSETTDIYSGLLVYEMKDGEPSLKERKTPVDVFGAEAKGYYFTTVRIGNIPSEVFDTCVFVIRPYWITMDGTYVEGLAECDRVSDGKNGIVNISVNIKDVKKETEGIAAGRLSVQYAAADFTYEGADFGRVFEEMEINPADGVVKCVGNVKDISKDSLNPNDVFVNLRFKKTSTNQLEAGKAVFTVSDTEFCDKDENTISANVLNVKF